MPINDDLSGFAADAAGRLGFRSIGAQMDAIDAIDEEQDEPAEDVEATADAEPSYEELSASFFEGLSASERAAAEGSDSIRQRLWDSFLAKRGYDVEDTDDADDADDGDEGLVPQTGADVVAWAARNEAGLVAEGWDSAADFVVVAASDARWWLETSRDMGWPATARPGQRDLPAGLGMAVIAAGIPGARVIHDPLESMFSKDARSSKSRTWR